MFKCQACGQSTPANTSPVKTIIATRKKIYPERFKIIPPKGHKKAQRIKIDNGGEGRETVREIMLCPACAGGDGIRQG